jgi:hypothetical protein
VLLYKFFVKKKTDFVFLQGKNWLVVHELDLCKSKYYALNPLVLDLIFCRQGLTCVHMRPCIMEGVVSVLLFVWTCMYSRRISQMQAFVVRVNSSPDLHLYEYVPYYTLSVTINLQGWSILNLPRSILIHFLLSEKEREFRDLCTYIRTLGLYMVVQRIHTCCTLVIGIYRHSCPPNWSIQNGMFCMTIIPQRACKLKQYYCILV